MKRLVLFLLLFVSLATMYTTTVKAQTIIFQDDFSNKLDKWQPVRGDIKLWDVVTDSQNKARAQVATRSTVTELVPKDQYWDPKTKNYSYEFEYTPIQGVDRNLGFGFQDTNNWYEIHFVEHDYNLVRLKDGIVTMNFFKSYTLENGKTYQMKIVFFDGHIQIFIDGKEIADEVDWSFNNNYGKISMKAGTGDAAPTVVEFGNIVVKTVSQNGKQLNVGIYKQTDPKWSDEEYDTASVWSPDGTTIRRWGCALTSLAMIMRYHLITLPNGTEINPSNLNAWLKSQPDGYIGGGVNFVAATRLSLLTNQVFGTVKLEYGRVDGANSIATAKSEINNNKPVIMQIPNHFLVADGINSDSTDLYIKDPAYIFTKFSQHKVDPLSVRTFQPSHTDLSYLLFSHVPTLNVVVKDASGQVVSDVQSFSDMITDPTIPSKGNSPMMSTDQLAKPADGKYTLEVSQAQPGFYNLNAIAYDTVANPTFFPQSGFVGSAPARFILDYHRTGPVASKMIAVVDFTKLRADLKLLNDLKKFSRASVYLSLDQFAAYGEKAAPAQRSRYTQQMLVYLRQNAPYIGADAKGFLEQEVASIQ